MRENKYVDTDPDINREGLLADLFFLLFWVCFFTTILAFEDLVEEIATGGLNGVVVQHGGVISNRILQ